jgi:hypothetical protein
MRRAAKREEALGRGEQAPVKPDAVQAARRISPRGAQRLYAVSSWRGFGAILLHNLEEALAAPSWLASHAGELQSRFGLERIPAADGQAFNASLAALTLVCFLWIAVASRARAPSFGVYSVAFLFSIFFCNALVPHSLGALLFRGYFPGVLTAVGLVIPLTTWWSIRAYRDGWVAGPAFALAVASGFVLYVPALRLLFGVW